MKFKSNRVQLRNEVEGRVRKITGQEKRSIFVLEHTT